MQYVGKVSDYVYNQWNALNPATLLGAIDIIVIEQPDGTLHCSPWHVRFGKLQIIKPLQKKIDLYVNDMKTDLPMKLGDGGEAFFVFETSNYDMVSKSVETSPVISASSSTETSPIASPQVSPYSATTGQNAEPESLDLNDGSGTVDLVEKKSRLSATPHEEKEQHSRNATSPTPLQRAFEKARKVTQKLNIPSKIDINGDMVLDIDGYKPNARKNIDVSHEYFKKIFLKELMDLANNNENREGSRDNEQAKKEYTLWDRLIVRDDDDNIRILNDTRDETDSSDDLNKVREINRMEPINSSLDESSLNSLSPLNSSSNNFDTEDKKYFKTLRLTSEQLKSMNLHYGSNSLKFKLNQGSSQIISYLYLWKASTPLVISDIDGTITKSDALGHVLNIIGKDWTHAGVAKLFSDIAANGYNILYLTARSVGQADSTRQYLNGIVQDGVHLPKGPVILSPDRTIAALHREVILKKPEVFKMSCLNDIKDLYLDPQTSSMNDYEIRTPFYAGFGNRITDAISYRSVKIPTHRIFTINPNGEVHMELLELAGYKSSYLHIGELVDHFFPPVKETRFHSYMNEEQLNRLVKRDGDLSQHAPSSPLARSASSVNEDLMLGLNSEEKYNDVNYWRDPLPSLSDLTDTESSSEEKSIPGSPKTTGSKSAPSMKSQSSTNVEKNEKPTSSSFASPLKSFMIFGSLPSVDLTIGKRNGKSSTESAKSPKGDLVYHEDNDEDEDEDEDDDYTDDDYDKEDDDYDDEDYEEEEEEDNDEVGPTMNDDLDDLDDDNFDEDALSYDDDILSSSSDKRYLDTDHNSSHKLESPGIWDKSKPHNSFRKASDILNNLSLQ